MIKVSQIKMQTGGAAVLSPALQKCLHATPFYIHIVYGNMNDLSRKDFGGMKMQLTAIQQALLDESDAKYREFSKSLTKETALPLLGVRLPRLRVLAAQIARDDARGFLEACDFSSVEMTMLYAFVLGRLRGEIDEALSWFARAVPHIDNWANCDTLCQSFKQAEKYSSETWAYLMTLRTSEAPFELRVLVVMLLSHFLTDAYIDRVLEVLETTRCEAYYYKMGAAWALATAMAKYREKTFVFLETTALDDWTYNKAIQKMLESYRVSPEDKARLRTMKRK